jgi:hypothetical protein
VIEVLPQTHGEDPGAAEGMLKTSSELPALSITRMEVLYDYGY